MIYLKINNKQQLTKEKNNMSKVIESIFNGKNVVIPMADVSHIEKKLIVESDLN